VLRLHEREALERAPKRKDRPGRPFGSVSDVAGKVWSLPNNALGLGYGLAGYAAGQLNRLRPGDQPDPRIQFGNNAVEFVDNPFGGEGAITLGNTITYSGDPYDPNDEGWAGYRATYGHPVQEHEKQHTYQGQQLGPLYLPSNIAGLGLSLARRERDKFDQVSGHGSSNWNERGPQMIPPRPWAAKDSR
jgi:hypothetical protein